MEVYTSMKIETLLFQLKQAANIAEDQPEMAHLMADNALLEYINNSKVTEAYDESIKFYGRDNVIQDKKFD